MDKPINIYKQRVPKGLYKKIRNSEIKGIAGIDDPCEVLLKPDLMLTH